MVCQRQNSRNLWPFVLPAFVGNPSVVTEATMPEQQATRAFPDKWTHRDAAGASALRACLIRWDFRFIVGGKIPHGGERTMNERLPPVNATKVARLSERAEDLAAAISRLVGDPHAAKLRLSMRSAGRVPLPASNSDDRHPLTAA